MYTPSGTTKNEKIILTDCDGVLLNWNLAFSAWMLKNGYTLYDEHEYSIGKRYRLGSDEAGNELVRLFNSSPSVGELGPYADAVHYVRKLHADHHYRFIVITCLSDSPESARYRRRNLYNVFGANVFKDIICLPLNSSKVEALSPWKDTDLFWIEDKPEYCQDGADLGLHALLLTHPHNKKLNFPALPRFNNWQEIYNYIQ